LLEDLIIPRNNSLSLAIECPFLSGISSFDLDQNFVRDWRQIPAISLRDNVELSVAIEPILWMIFTSLVCLLVLNISHIPSWAPVTETFLDNNVLFVLNAHVHSSLIHELITHKLEHLEPSTIGFPNLHVVGISSILDIPWLVFVCYGFDSLGIRIQINLLGYLISLKFFKS
jgi:hypothetical protein